MAHSEPGTILPHPEPTSILSKDDGAALNELSDPSQVRAWTRRKVAKHEKYISALLAIHNSVAPINKLPTEILEMVFAEVPSESPWCNASWMLSLQSVCRRWRSVLLSMPDYWLRGLYTALDPWNHGDPEVNDSDEDEEEDEDEDTEDERRERRKYLVELFLDRSAPLPLELKVWRAPYEHFMSGKRFEGRFDRITTFEVIVDDKDDFYNVFHMVATQMKRLENLELFHGYEYENYGEFSLDQWKAENLPCLRRLRTDALLFCRAMTVPSLHTITLCGRRDIGTLPGLLDALEDCPALATIHQLHFYTDPTRSRNEDQTLGRIVTLPNLRSLDVSGEMPDLSLFFSRLSFSSDTRIDAHVDCNIDGKFTLPSFLPRRLSRLHTSLTINRLYVHSDPRNHLVRFLGFNVSMIGSVGGAERLAISPAFRLYRARDFLQFLGIFAACTVTELALDFDPLPTDVDGKFWKQFLVALPDVRRLELMSRTVESSGMKRVIAEHFLASVQPSQQAGYETSLAWVLRGEVGSASHLEEELGDFEEILCGHAHRGGHLSRLELYVTASGPGTTQWPKISGVAQIRTDSEASRFVTKDYVSRLAGVADAVIVGGGWGSAEDDGPNAEHSEDRAMGLVEDKEEEASSDDDMQVV